MLEPPDPAGWTGSTRAVGAPYQGAAIRLEIKLATLAMRSFSPVSLPNKQCPGMCAQVTDHTIMSPAAQVELMSADPSAVRSMPEPQPASAAEQQGSQSDLDDDRGSLEFYALSPYGVFKGAARLHEINDTWTCHQLWLQLRCSTPRFPRSHMTSNAHSTQTNCLGLKPRVTDS